MLQKQLVSGTPQPPCTVLNVSEQTRVSAAQRQILDFAGPPPDKAAGPFPTARCFATPRPVRNKTPRVWGISFDGCCELPDSIAYIAFPDDLGEVVRAGLGVTYWGSSAKAATELGYAPRDLASGLRATFDAA